MHVDDLVVNGADGFLQARFCSTTVQIADFATLNWPTIDRLIWPTPDEGNRRGCSEERVGMEGPGVEEIKGGIV